MPLSSEWRESRRRFRGIAVPCGSVAIVAQCPLGIRTLGHFVMKRKRVWGTAILML